MVKGWLEIGYYSVCGKPVYISDDLKTAYLGRIESMKETAPVIVACRQEE